MAKEIQIYQLPAIEQITNDDVFMVESDEISYKVNGSTLIEYIKTHPDITGQFIDISKVGVANGVIPLDSDKKIKPTYLTFGKVKGTIYEGSEGKTLEENFSRHKTDTTNPHNVTAEQVGLGKVENKTAIEILNELTVEYIKNALGYIPEVDGTYEQATAYTDLKISELINGAPETLNTLKEISDAMTEQSDILNTLNEAISKKANELEFASHVNDRTIHVTQIDKNKIDESFEHANAAHARTDATNVTRSNTNGNVMIDGVETPVYQHPLSGVVAGTYRQVIVDNLGHIIGGNNTTLPIAQGGTGATTAAQALINLGILATIDEINKMSGVTVSTAEINRLKDVTSPIQTQLNNKAPKEHGNHVPNSSESTLNSFLSSDGVDAVWKSLTKEDIVDALGYTPGTGSNILTAVKGDAEEDYHTGYVNITPESIGLGRINNTADSEKSVLSASKLITPRKIGNANFDGTQNITLDDIGASAVNHTHDEYYTTDVVDEKLNSKAPTSHAHGDIKEIKLVSSLPSDASSHTDVLYLIG